MKRKKPMLPWDVGPYTYLPPEQWACSGDPNCETCRALDDLAQQLGRPVPASREKR